MPPTTPPACEQYSRVATAGAHRDAVVLNTALALEVTGAVPDAAEAVRAAGVAIDRGDAVRLLERLRGVRPPTTNR